MPQRPTYAMELLEMRRFGDRRPRGNMVVITDDRTVSNVCREKLGIFALLVEPFLPYNLGLCFDMDVLIVMNGACDLVVAGLRRAGPRSLKIDFRGTVFWTWIEWLIEVRAGRAGANCIEWFERGGPEHPPPGTA